MSSETFLEQRTFFEQEGQRVMSIEDAMEYAVLFAVEHLEEILDLNPQSFGNTSIIIRRKISELQSQLSTESK